MKKPVSVEQYKLVTSFESVRHTLLTKNDQRLAKPLAYWAMPNDRRLPLALLDKTLTDLLSHPFDELSATPGIGQKKMGAMIKLLLRAANEPEHGVPFGLADLAESDDGADPGTLTPNGFDSSTVSETEWTRWTQTAARHSLLNETLGRLAPSLADLPTVIWDRPLGFYVKHSVAEIRRLKTHGEKRVSVVLEVFHAVDAMLSPVPAGGFLSVKLLPRFAQQIDAWVAAALRSETLFDVDALRKHVINPMLRQTKIDLGETIHKLCEGRIGPRGKTHSVKAQSRKTGVTRARVYQLLDECAKAFAVRWPEGRCQLDALIHRLEQEDGSPEAIRMLGAARQTYFPRKLEGEANEAAED